MLLRTTLWCATLGALVIAPVSRAQAQTCDPSRRQLLGGLKCDDPGAKTWYQIEVYYGCEPQRGGGAEPVLEVKERRPDMVETRRALRRSEIKSFIMNGLRAGTREPALFTTVLEGGVGKDREVCGEETREHLGELRCGEGDSALALDLDMLCLPVMKLPIPHMVAMDLGGKTPKTKVKMMVADAAKVAHSNIGKVRASMWKGKLSRGGQAELEALLKPDGSFYDLVAVKLFPKEGQPCEDLVQIDHFWRKKWPPIPRHGFIEAAAVKFLGADMFNAVHLSIVPLVASPCEKYLDVSEAWQRTWE